MEVAFFIPPHYLPDEERRKAWQNNEVRVFAGGKIACVDVWMVQTAARLEEAGFGVRVVTEMPEAGPVVAVAGTLADDYRPPPSVYLIAVAADGMPHPAAQFHILQNRAFSRIFPRSAFIPLWSQPGILPRDPSRGSRFENVAFYGDPNNLAPELADPGFADRLVESHGLQFRIVPASHWHDYTETDCAIAVRAFSRKPHFHKPSTKLVNAWQGGVPFLGGPESAYASDGSPGKNYLRIGSLGATLSALDRLKKSPELRERLVENGRMAAPGYGRESISKRWICVLRQLCEKRVPAWIALSESQRKRALGWQRLQVRVASKLIF